MTNTSTTTTCQRQIMIMTDVAKVNYTVLQWSYAILSVPTIVANIIVLVVFYKLNNYKNRHHMLLFMLTIADVLSGLTVQPLIAYDFALLKLGINKCSISNMTRMLGFTFTMMSITTIAFINIDFFIAIVKPYKTPLSLQSILLTLGGFWIVISVSTILCVYAFPNQIQKFKMVVSIYVVTTFLVICGLQFRIYIEIQSMLARSQGPANTKSIDMQLKMRVQQMSKSVLIAFGVCYMPAILCGIYQMFESDQSFTSTYIRTWAYFISYLNPMLDPIIYCFRLKTFHDLLIRRFKTKSSRENSQVSNSKELQIAVIVTVFDTEL